MAVLITGGAGYIGSHTAAQLLAKGEEVVIVDNLQTGHREAVLGGTFYEADIRDSEALDEVFRKHDIEAVIHFAANSLVGESVTKPLAYYDNNVYGSQKLMEAMVRHHVQSIVFSSTAAVYGEPNRIPIDEHDPTQPTNPYGETKLTMEKMFRWGEQAYGIRSISLRYFNAAGAHPEGILGEDHQPETHLIPVILQVPLGSREFISVFGDDYATEDGTCVRDYIHVTDLAEAHYLALQKLRSGAPSSIYNLGNGKGFSVNQVIDVTRRVTGHAIPSKVSPRRPGDPAVLVASAERAKQELGWQPQYESLETIVETAWQWFRRHPQGYQK